MKRFTSAPLVTHDSGRPSWLYHAAQWIALAVKESDMIRINAHYFYRLATQLRPLVTIEAGKDIFDVFSELTDAEEALKGFLWNDVMPPETAFNDGRTLLAHIEKLLNELGRDEPLNAYEVGQISTALSKFEHVLSAEFARKDAYYVSKKGIYSTSELIEQAENLFDEEVRNRIPNAIPDLKQAGRCLAFELPTAAAFHLFRAVESVSKQYVEIFRGTPPTGKSELGLGNHARILRTTDADVRVVNTLDQIRSLHRNPIAHPEVSLTMNEVKTLFGITASVIQAMVADMETKEPLPDPEILDTLPDPDLLDPEIEEDEPEDNSNSSSNAATTS
ncbi:MAG TPA: hypothetical protein VF779_09335 [Pyrinomonadaceae bacterium]